MDKFLFISGIFVSFWTIGSFILDILYSTDGVVVLEQTKIIVGLCLIYISFKIDDVNQDKGVKDGK